MDLNHARDWFCQQNNVNNNVEIFHFKESYEFYIWAMDIDPVLADRIYQDDYGLAMLCPKDYYNRAYVVLTPNCRDSEILSSLFHELVHHRQYEKGDLRTYRYGGWKDVFWKSQLIHPNTPYMDLPWEKEAFAEMYYWENQYGQLFGSAERASPKLSERPKLSENPEFSKIPKINEREIHV